eukprot:9930074-Alexandrium_andersonii.AAC.1
MARLWGSSFNATSSGPATSRSRASPSSCSGRTAGTPTPHSLTPETCATVRRSTPACPCSR